VSFGEAFTLLVTLLAAIGGPLSVVYGVRQGRGKTTGEAHKAKAEGEAVLSDAVLRFADRLQARLMEAERRIDELETGELSYKASIRRLEIDVRHWQTWARALEKQLVQAGLEPTKPNMDED
jgi:TolA-binding protein